MPPRKDVKDVLRAIGEADLARIARVADLALRGRPGFFDGPLRRRNYPGRGTDFLDYQQYVPGTDVRAVDWRASARSRHHLVRRHHDEVSSEWYICLDRSASMGVGDGRKWLLAVELAAAFVFLLLHKADRVGVLAFSTEVDAYCPAGRGRRQYERVASVLADTVPMERGGGSDLAACARWMGRNRSVIVISDFLVPDAMISGLHRILRLGGELHAVQVLRADECTPDAEEYPAVEDVESGRRLPIVSGVSARMAAERRLERLCDDLARYCRGKQIHFTRCAPEQTWQSIIVDHLQSAVRGDA